MERLPDSVLAMMAVATHVHTHFPANPTCCGTQTIEEIAALAQTLGFEGVAFADHTSDPTNPSYVYGIDPLFKRILDHLERIRRVGRGSFVRLFPGLECNILPGGRLDILSPDLILIASQHGGLGAAEKDPQAIQQRLQTCCAFPEVDILGHPTRYNDEVVGVRWSEIFATCATTNTAVEVNFNLWFKGPGQVILVGCGDEHLDWVGHINGFWESWLWLLADSGAPVSIGLDIHNLGMWPVDSPTEIKNPSVAKLVEFLDLVTASGIPTDRIINSSLELFEHWFHCPKSQRNLLMTA